MRKRRRQAVNVFLQNDLLAQASASNQPGLSGKPDPDLKVRTALDGAAARITGKFDHQPEVEAAIRDTKPTWPSGYTRRHASKFGGHWIFGLRLFAAAFLD
jgi:hypothetical protein